MRSRYSAYATGNIDWIERSQAPEGRQVMDRSATEEWSRKSIWKGLEILETRDGGPDDAEGVVEFKARYELAGQDTVHHEIATFRKEEGLWYFVDGLEIKPRPYRRAEPRVGPNEPCPCGSGKKFKKCCGRPGAPPASA